MPTLYVNDIIEFQPQWGCARIITVTGLGKDGFQGVLTANRTQKAVGRYDQITRILRRANPAVNHKTKTTAVGATWVAWRCVCGFEQTGRGDDTEAAMRNSRVQQEMHRRDMRELDDD